MDTFSHKPKILVVDDDIFIVTLIEKTLAGNGYFVIKAFNGEEALKKVDDEEPDLVILDLMMPKIDGLEVCRRLRSNEMTRLVPIVMLTGKDYIEDKITGLETGADDYIIKPFNTKELLARIKGLINKKIHQDNKAEQEKLEALENLVESVAHEVRNPIMAIGGFARRIRDRLPEGNNLKMYADHILHEVVRLETMLNEIVKLKTIIVAAPTLLNLKEIVDCAFNNYIDSIQEMNITVQKQYVSEASLIRGDGKSVETAISHVIKNAVESMNNGGILSITIATENQYHIVRISDTGKGIKKNELPLVIRPFYTSKMSGTGMGLTIVKQILMLHGGDISISSTEGKGTQVTLLFPIFNELNKTS